MSSQKFILAFVLFTLIASSFQEPELSMVIEVFRHGARQAAWTEYWYPPEFQFPGELTSVGMRQHFNLGTALREKYINQLGYLPDEYDPLAIYVRSTDVNRTLMSAESQLYGLYPLGTGKTLPTDIDMSLTYAPFFGASNNDTGLIQGNDALPYKYQPIPINTVQSSSDYLLDAYMSFACPNQGKIQAQNFFSEAFTTINNEMEPTLQTLKQLFNITKNITLFDAYGINDNMQCATYAGYPIPEEVKQQPPEFWKNLTFMYEVAWYLVNYQTQSQLNTINTYLYTDFIKTFSNVINGGLSYKWQMLSAHDTTIMQLLAGLNYTSYQCIYDIFKNGTTDALTCLNQYPTYASNLILELYNDSSAQTKPYVKIMYDGIYLQMCGVEGSYQCDFDIFSQMLQDHILSPQEFDIQCGINQQSQFLNQKMSQEKYISLLNEEFISKRLNQNSFFSKSSTIISMVAISILLLFALIVFVKKFTKNVKPETVDNSSLVYFQSVMTE